jgi:hypothetical protein
MRITLRHLAAIGLWAALAGVAPAAADLRVEDLGGRVVDPLVASAGARAVVLLFVSVDCPVSNRYAPEVRRLHDRLAPEGVRFWLVYPNPLETPAAIRAHLKAFGYPAAAVRDPHQDLARRVGASITPEAAVFDRDRRVVYRGRIDDRYVSLGVERPAPTRRDLALALSATLSGHAVEMPMTQAVGCFIADFAHLH